MKVFYLYFLLYLISLLIPYAQANKEIKGEWEIIKQYQYKNNGYYSHSVKKNNVPQKRKAIKKKQKNTNDQTVYDSLSTKKKAKISQSNYKRECRNSSAIRRQHEIALLFKYLLVAQVGLSTLSSVSAQQAHHPLGNNTSDRFDVDNSFFSFSSNFYATTNTTSNSSHIMENTGMLGDHSYAAHDGTPAAVPKKEDDFIHNRKRKKESSNKGSHTSSFDEYHQKIKNEENDKLEISAHIPMHNIQKNTLYNRLEKAYRKAEGCSSYEKQEINIASQKGMIPEHKKPELLHILEECESTTNSWPAFNLKQKKLIYQQNLLQ